MDSFLPTVPLFRPDLMMFEQVLTHCWRLVCRAYVPDIAPSSSRSRSMPSRRTVSINGAVFCHVYRGYLLAQWVLSYLQKLSLNGVILPPFFRAKRHELLSLYSGLPVPVPIRRAVRSILSPIIVYSRIFFPAPPEIYTNYDQPRDYFHGAILDQSVAPKSIDFSMSYQRVLTSFGLDPLPYSMKLSEASPLPGHASSLIQLPFFEVDSDIVSYETDLAPQFSSVVKPLPCAHDELWELFRHCPSAIPDLSKLRFSPVVLFKATPVCAVDVKGVSIDGWSVLHPVSLLTESERKIALTINPDTIAKVVINRSNDTSDLNVADDEFLENLTRFLTTETGSMPFLKRVLDELTLSGEQTIRRDSRFLFGDVQEEEEEKEESRVRDLSPQKRSESRRGGGSTLVNHQVVDVRKSILSRSEIDFGPCALPSRSRRKRRNQGRRNRGRSEQQQQQRGGNGNGKRNGRSSARIVNDREKRFQVPSIQINSRQF